jgi:hypothetical protein
MPRLQPGCRSAAGPTPPAPSRSEVFRSSPLPHRVRRSPRPAVVRSLSILSSHAPGPSHPRMWRTPTASSSCPVPTPVMPSRSRKPMRRPPPNKCPLWSCAAAREDQTSTASAPRLPAVGRQPCTARRVPLDRTGTGPPSEHHGTPAGEAGIAPKIGPPHAAGMRVRTPAKIDKNAAVTAPVTTTALPSRASPATCQIDCRNSDCQFSGLSPQALPNCRSPLVNLPCMTSPVCGGSAPIRLRSIFRRGVPRSKCRRSGYS